MLIMNIYIFIKCVCGVLSVCVILCDALKIWQKIMWHKILCVYALVINIIYNMYVCLGRDRPLHGFIVFFLSIMYT